MAERKMGMRPLADRVIVEPVEQDEKTAGGLLLPESATERPQAGTAVAIGPGRWDADGKQRVAMEVAVGDKVIFAKYSGSEVKLNEKKYLIMSEQDVLAVFDQ